MESRRYYVSVNWNLVTTWREILLTSAYRPRSYNRYLAVAARVVRRSLKDNLRVQAERRGEMELRFAKWEVSHRMNWTYRVEVILT